MCDWNTIWNSEFWHKQKLQCSTTWCNHNLQTQLCLENLTSLIIFKITEFTVIKAWSKLWNQECRISLAACIMSTIYVLKTQWRNPILSWNPFWNTASVHNGALSSNYSLLTCHSTVTMTTTKTFSCLEKTIGILIMKFILLTVWVKLNSTLKKKIIIPI